MVGVKKEPISLPPGTIYGLRTHQKCLSAGASLRTLLGEFTALPGHSGCFFWGGFAAGRKEKREGKGTKGRRGEQGEGREEGSWRSASGVMIDAPD